MESKEVLKPESDEEDIVEDPDALFADLDSAEN
jgi:hypothetical protein